MTNQLDMLRERLQRTLAALDNGDAMSAQAPTTPIVPAAPPVLPPGGEIRCGSVRLVADVTLEEARAIAQRWNEEDHPW